MCKSIQLLTNIHSKKACSLFFPKIYNAICVYIAHVTSQIPGLDVLFHFNLNQPKLPAAALS